MSAERWPDSYIAGFVRDALRIGASPRTVANVLRCWAQHGVEVPDIVIAIDAVAREGTLEPRLLESYRVEAMALLPSDARCASCLGAGLCWICVGSGEIEGPGASVRPCVRCLGTGLCRGCSRVTLDLSATSIPAVGEVHDAGGGLRRTTA